MKKQLFKPNSYAVLGFFMSYVKHNRMAFIYMYILSIVFTFFLGASLFRVYSTMRISPTTVLAILWAIEAIAFSSQNFLQILFDFKQTTIFRRIGLVRVKPINFILVASVFNLLTNLIANVIIFVTFVIWMYFWNPALLTAFFNYKLLIVIIFSLAFTFLISSLIFLLIIIINNRTTLSVMSFILTFALSILTSFLILLYAILPELIPTIKNWQLALILIFSFMSMIGLTSLFYWIGNERFQWKV